MHYDVFSPFEFFQGQFLTPATSIPELALNLQDLFFEFQRSPAPASEVRLQPALIDAIFRFLGYISPLP
jgi:hypothetical protein